MERTITDIILELRNHPDYFHAEIFDKQDIMNEIIGILEDESQLEGEELTTFAEKFYQENKELYADGVERLLTCGYGYINPYERGNEELSTTIEETFGGIE
jgi:hypothetical protein